MEETREKIRTFIRRFYRKGTLNDDEDMYARGIFNSLFTLQLATFLAKEFGVRLESNEYIFKELNTVNRICLRIYREKSAAGGMEYYSLPNGMTVAYLNKAETDQFYEDIFEKECYTANGITISKNNCIFDVGANIGLFTLYALQKHMDIKVYAFEPVPSIFKILQENCLSYEGKIVLYNCGLSNTEGEASFTFYPNTTGMSSFYGDIKEEREVLETVILNQVKEDLESGKSLLEYSLDERLRCETLRCRLRTISSVINEQCIESIDLLKIDVQKSEFDVLLGVDESHWNKIRQIVMEVHDIEGRVGTMVEFLENHGFSTVVAQDEIYKGTIIFNIYAVNGRRI